MIPLSSLSSSVNRFISFQSPSRVNTFINFIPQQEVWVIERFGKFDRLAHAGINIVIPAIEKIAYVHSLKEITIPVEPQPAVTQDNVQIRLTGNIYLRVMDPFKASYNITDPIFAVTQLAQTALRSVCGISPCFHFF